MGITDWLWPFEKKFSDIPGAREATMAALVGGSVVGAFQIIINRPKLAFPRSVNSGFVIFWISFTILQFREAKMKLQTSKFKDAVNSGKLD